MPPETFAVDASMLLAVSTLLLGISVGAWIQRRQVELDDDVLVRVVEHVHG